MDNIHSSIQIIKQLQADGVHTYCLCPSSRNAPLVEVLSAYKNIEKFYFFDERSAGFFALGRSKRDFKPVCVVTTSGTAVCELYPAVVEAYYSQASLVLLTADRPSAFKGTAAPQCIEQKNIFSNYVCKSWDLEAGDKLKINWWKKPSSIHINVRFDEPLLSTKNDILKNLDSDHFSTPTHFKKEHSIDNTVKENKIITAASPTHRNLYDVNNKKKVFSENSKIYDDKKSSEKSSLFFSPNKKSIRLSIKEKFRIQRFFKKCHCPVVLAGELPLYLREPVESFLQALNLPVYAEPLSHLRESEKLLPLLLKSENIFTMTTKEIDGVIRVGAVPVLRFWRDLNKLSLPVLSISLSPFSGLKNKPTPCSLNAFLNDQNFLNSVLNLKKKMQKSHTLLKPNAQAKKEKIFEKDRKLYLEKKAVLSRQPQSEPAWFQFLSEKIPSNSHIFLGNSLPIREWDHYARRVQKNFRYSANRGANGIDGLLSSFLGSCISEKPNYCILGDLSLLYDLSAPWILKSLKEYEIHIIVINNYGGSIFKDKFTNPVYINQHSVHFKDFAKMWNLNYLLCEKKEDFIQRASPSLIEIVIPSHNDSY